MSRIFELEYSDTITVYRLFSLAMTSHLLSGASTPPCLVTSSIFGGAQQAKLTSISETSFGMQCEIVCERPAAKVIFEGISFDPKSFRRNEQLTQGGHLAVHTVTVCETLLLAVYGRGADGAEGTEGIEGAEALGQSASKKAPVHYPMLRKRPVLLCTVQNTIFNSPVMDTVSNCKRFEQYSTPYSLKTTPLIYYPLVTRSLGAVAKADQAGSASVDCPTTKCRYPDFTSLTVCSRCEEETVRITGFNCTGFWSYSEGNTPCFHQRADKGFLKFYIDILVGNFELLKLERRMNGGILNDQRGAFETCKYNPFFLHVLQLDDGFHLAQLWLRNPYKRQKSKILRSYSLTN
ncbi:uncharacterized protein BDR25DRAFT_357392 [Lindgomyces ingoldianus]|uniref:Uncharacterized protein n=1 Tax=Lindgomyces ingoldianus TaxID=673940 RepID=A0ACB6QNL0_9PLEO|nr:uncharacterized protein BDR25DRAFT_357392 [Lindgomyces ingoldianus]KAF2468465.1 hypothetical protein BDR25DRAFT_357392 [Lindgomyces ingoldianus]